MHFLRTVVFTAAIVPIIVLAQSPTQLARRVESATNGSMRLVSSNGSIAQVITATGKGYSLLTSSAASDRQAVSTAVKLWLGRYSNDLFALRENAELRESETERIGNLWQSSFELLYNGIPVREQSVKVNTGALSGAIMMVRTNVTTAEPNASVPTITHEAVKTAALKEVVSHRKEIGPIQEVYIGHGRVLQLAYEVVAGSPDQERWRLTYDALSGKLLEKKSMLFDRCFENDGVGEEAAYDVPQQSTKQQSITPQAAAGGRITALVHPNTPTDQLTEVGLPGMDITVNGFATRTDSLGFWSLPTVSHPLIVQSALQNTYLNVHAAGSPLSTVVDTIAIGQGNIKWTDANSTQSERDALYSLLRTRAYIKSIEPDLDSIDQPLVANVDYDATCNAYYDADTKSFTFFTSSSTCNATAQVADVVYHEYGHRVNHCRYANTTVHNMQDLSLNEGFADIYSALMRDDPRIGLGFFTNASRILRNCENTRKWPTNIDPDPHINGMIVAGAYWDLRKATDLKTATYLFHSMSRLTPDGNGFVDAQSLRDAFTNVLVATILADDDDNDLSNGTPHLGAITSSFAKHNITLANLLKLEPTPVADQPVEAAEYPIKVHASYTGPVGALDETSVTFHFSTDGKSYNVLPLMKSTTDLYEGVLLKVPAGTIVYYYTSASTTLGHVNENPSKDEPLRFLVGFEQKFYDDFETDKSWTHADSAETGRWTRGEPFGTSFSGAENLFIQQDTDHTATSASCYITGNASTSSPSIDDVDNGYTKLISPALDLVKMRDPYIRYWYYYSNDMGQNPGLSNFAVELSSDKSNWKEVLSTTTATLGWQQMLVRIKDYVPLTNDVRIRFVASDTIGSLVEAGVDDVEVLDPVAGEDVAVDTKATEGGIQVYPQPVSTNELHLHLSAAAGSNITVSLKDLIGVERFVRTMSDAADDLSIRLPATLANGVYLLEVKAEKNTTSVKVVLAR